MVVEFNMYLQNVEFPRPGEYRFQILSAGRPIMERRLMAVQIQAPNPREDDVEG